jgi:hypothetical protein
VLAACVGHSVAHSRHILKTTSRQGQRHTTDQPAAQAGTLVCASASEQFTVSDQTALVPRGTGSQVTVTKTEQPILCQEATSRSNTECIVMITMICPRESTPCILTDRP